MTKKTIEINTLGKPSIREVWRADYPSNGKKTLSWTVIIPADFSDDVRIEITNSSKQK